MSKDDLPFSVVLCDYCGEVAPYVTGREVYPHRRDLYAKRFYQCRPCDAMVGVHPGTDKPLGRLANKELRLAKMAAHAAFDPIWQQGHKKRGSAYGWLADQLGIKSEDCHIGMFDVDMCNRVVTVCECRSVSTVTRSATEIVCSS